MGWVPLCSECGKKGKKPDCPGGIWRVLYFQYIKPPAKKQPPLRKKVCFTIDMRQHGNLYNAR